MERRMQVQCQAKQKNKSELDNNNDGNAKSGKGTRKERERINQQICIYRQKDVQKPLKMPGFLQRPSGPCPIETKREGFHSWKRNRIRAN